MKITELKKDKTEYQAKVTIPKKDIAGRIEKELAKIAKTAKMDGFRVGKVPVHILKKKYASSIRIDIVREQMNLAINDCLKKNDLNIATDPNIEDLVNAEDKDLEFILKFELLPEITLPDFKKISIEKPKLEVSDKDVQEQLDRLSSFSKTYDKESKTKAQKGDQVTIDAIGYVDGEAFEGGKLDNHKLVLGSNAFIPGFEDQLIGSKAGEDVTVKVNFPQEYHAKDLAGKPSEFKVKVKSVHKETPFEINDEFAKRFNCDNVEKLKEQISKNIEASYAEPIHVLMKMNLFDKLEKMLKFDIPQSLLDREKSILKKQTHEMGYDDPANKDKSDKETEDYFTNLASRRVRIGLMLAEYVKQKKLQIQEDDIRKAIIAQARNYPGQEQQVIEFYKNNREAIESLKGPILEEKGVREIFDKEIIVNTKTYPKTKLEKLLDEEAKETNR